MAGARRSTRQTTSTAPKYNDDSAASDEDTAPPRNVKKPTRRKRARDDDGQAEEEDGSPPPKKAARSEPKSTESKPTKKTAPPAPTSPTNRDPAGFQQVFWLLKAEPTPRYENGVNVAFSIDDLAACTTPEPWSGVRNPQARNNMQAMRKGDLAFFYHSNAKPSGVVGIMKIVEEAKVDETAFDEKDAYYDKKSERERPKWFCVGVEFVSKFDDVVSLHEIKSLAGSGGALEGMQLVTNSRLSVSRVRREEWEVILGLADGKKESQSKEGDEE